MKLKKIASLALAGVMAVSMLAGCATKAPETDNNEGTQVEPTTSVVADALNAADTKVTFTEDAELTAALKAAVEVYGKNAKETDLEKEIVRQTGIGGELADLGNAFTYDLTTKFDSNDENQTIVDVELYNAADYSNSQVLVLYKATQDLEKAYGKLADDDSQGKAPGATYHKYSYTGKTGMVTITDPDDGAVTYAVVTAVTRNVTEATLPNA